MSKVEESKRTSKFAVASISVGIFGIFCQLLLLIGTSQPALYGDYLILFYSTLELTLSVVIIASAILALLFGSLAIVNMRRSNNLIGRCLAITGIICGGELVLMSLFIIISELFVKHL
jgi:hypothetical protein